MSQNAETSKSIGVLVFAIVAILAVVVVGIVGFFRVRAMSAYSSSETIDGYYSDSDYIDAFYGYYEDSDYIKAD